MGTLSPWGSGLCSDSTQLSQVGSGLILLQQISSFGLICPIPEKIQMELSKHNIRCFIVKILSPKILHSYAPKLKSGLCFCNKFIYNIVGKHIFLND